METHGGLTDDWPYSSAGALLAFRLFKSNNIILKSLVSTYLGTRTTASAWMLASAACGLPEKAARSMVLTVRLAVGSQGRTVV